MFLSRWRRISSILIIIIAVLLTACSAERSGVDADAVFDLDKYEGELTVNFFHLENDEMQSGESILVHTPEGQSILIDAGIPEVGPIIDGYLDDMGIEKIDYAMPSHPHADHIGGYHTIFKTKDIGKLVDINVPHATATYEKYQEIIKEEDIEVEFAEAGDVYEIEDDLTLEILNPPKGTSVETMPDDYSSRSASHLNNVSMVIKMTYKDISFLFTGDIYLAQEVELVKEYGDELKVDVLVAPHHGDESSSSGGFIDAVNGDYVVIPSNRIASTNLPAKYFDLDYKVYHTVADGNVLFVTDGEEIDIITEKERPENSFVNP